MILEDILENKIDGLFKSTNDKFAHQGELNTSFIENIRDVNNLEERFETLELMFKDLNEQLTKLL